MTEKVYLDQYDNGDPKFHFENGKFEESELSEDQDAEIMQIIGELVFFFNEMESDLDRLIAETVNNRSHQSGYAIVAVTGSVFVKKILMFKSLYGQMVDAFKDEEFEKEFNELITLLFKLKDVRNDVVHANWFGADGKYNVRLRIQADEKGPYAIIKKMSPEYLNEMIEKMSTAIDKIEIFDEHKDQMLAHGRLLKEEDYNKND